MHRLLSSTIVVAAAAVIAESAGSPVPCTKTPDGELVNYRGGFDKYCVRTFEDPDGLNCDDCVSNGNAQYVKCTTSGTDSTWEYMSGQSPAVMISFDEWNCGGTARTYSDSDCTNYVGPQWTCLRTHTAVTGVMTPPGVNCP